MAQFLGQITLVVKDYDEAVEYYTQTLGFELVEDTVLSDVKRWVVIKPSGNGGANILLARAADELQSSRIGNQTGGRVFLFLYTDNIHSDYEMLLQNKVSIIRELEEQPHGWVCVFEDLYGNLWDLIEPR